MIFSARLRAIARRGLAGAQRDPIRYTRILAVLLAVFQAYGLAVGLEGAGSVVTDPGWWFRISTVVTLTGGTVFLIWLSDQMTARGIGNGIALLLAVGIVTELPAAIAGTLELGRQGGILRPIDPRALAVLMIVVTALVACMERGPPPPADRVLGAGPTDRAIGGRSSAADEAQQRRASSQPSWRPGCWRSRSVDHSLVGQARRLGWKADLIRRQPGGLRTWRSTPPSSSICVFFFTAFVLDPDEAAETLKRYGGVVPGIAPGEPTAEHLDLSSRASRWRGRSISRWCA